LGGNSAGGEHDARFLVGNIVVQAEISRKAKADGLGELLTALQAKADMTALPPVKNHNLPARGRAFGSENTRWAGGVPRGDEFSGARGIEGLDRRGWLSEWRGGDAGRLSGEHGSGVLVLLDYPTLSLRSNICTIWSRPCRTRQNARE